MKAAIQYSFVHTTHINFIKNNRLMPATEVAEILQITPQQVHTIRKREFGISKTDIDLEDQINEITWEIEAIQMKMNLYMKTAEARQRKLKEKLDEKRQYLRDLKAIAS
jgi:vacuolar-type H+-ATPase subunit I/STV1